MEQNTEQPQKRKRRPKHEVLAERHDALTKQLAEKTKELASRLTSGTAIDKLTKLQGEISSLQGRIGDVEKDQKAAVVDSYNDFAIKLMTRLVRGEVTRDAILRKSKDGDAALLQWLAEKARQ